MPDKNEYTAYYPPVRLGAWFYIQVFLLLMLFLGILYGAVMVISGKGERRDWISIVHTIIFISISNRLIQQYKKRKINHCFIKIDAAGISWRLPVDESYQSKENNIIVWSDIRKVILKEDGITIRYMSTYFTDTIPFASISEADKEQLLAVLRLYIKEKSIVAEERVAA